METLNYQATQAGVLVASGDGVATITADSVCQWLIGTSAVTAPSKVIKHRCQVGEDLSMTLGAGEYLWVFGSEIVAVTAENAAAGDI